MTKYWSALRFTLIFWASSNVIPEIHCNWLWRGSLLPETSVRFAREIDRSICHQYKKHIVKYRVSLIFRSFEVWNIERCSKTQILMKERTEPLMMSPSHLGKLLLCFWWTLRSQLLIISDIRCLKIAIEFKKSDVFFQLKVLSLSVSMDFYTYIGVHALSL